MTKAQNMVVASLALLTACGCGIFLAVITQDMMVVSTSGMATPTSMPIPTAMSTPTLTPTRTSTPTVISTPTDIPTPGPPSPTATPKSPPPTSRAEYARTMLTQLDRLTEVNELLEKTADLYAQKTIDYEDVERMLKTASNSVNSQIAILLKVIPPTEWVEIHQQSLLMCQTYRDAILIALEISQSRQGNPFGTTFNQKITDALREIDRTLLLMEEYEVLR